MQVVYSTAARVGLHTPRLLDGDYVYCGPKISDRKIGDLVLGMWAMPGEYDLRALAAQHGMVEKPDVLVVEGCVRNRPRNLSGFKCPKVLLVGDTHSHRGSLESMLQYVQNERFDRVILLHDSYHDHFFRELGCDTRWLPGINFPYGDTEVAACRQSKRAAHIAVADDEDRIESWPIALYRAITKTRLPLRFGGDVPEVALSHFGSSSIGVEILKTAEVSLSGLTAIAAGALLVTERRAQHTDLAPWLSDDRCATYSSPAELADVLRHFVDHPEEANNRAQAATRWFDQVYNEKARSELFTEVVFGNRPQSTTLPVHTSPLHGLRFGSGFDVVESLYRRSEKLRVFAGTSIPREFARALQLLPRVELVTSEAPDRNLDLLMGDTDDILNWEGLSSVRTVWCWQEVPVSGVLASRMASAGLIASASNKGWFERRTAATAVSADLKKAKDAVNEGRYQVALSLAQSLLGPKSGTKLLEPLLVLAELALEAGNREMFERVASQCRTLAQSDLRLEYLECRHSCGAPSRMLRRLMHAGEYWLERRSFDLALQSAYASAAAERNEGYGFLLRCLVAAGRDKDALAALDKIPNTAELDGSVMLDIGLAAFRTGCKEEGLSSVLHADALCPNRPEIELAIAHVAVGAEMWDVAVDSLDRLDRHDQLARAADKLRAKVTSRRKARQNTESRDLLICHGEVTRMHGTGVLIQRFFPPPAELLTLRSHTLYGGAVELGGRHFVFRGAGLTFEQRVKQLRLLFHGQKIRRILCIPYAEDEFVNAAAMHEITGAPVCTYVMDDQVIYGGVPEKAARMLLERSRLRLVISPEMRKAYAQRFGLEFTVMPPLVLSASARTPNRWTPKSAKQAVLVGNIWSETQFVRLRGLVNATGLKLDWFGNKNAPYLQGRHAELEREGICCRGFVPESELASRVAEYACVIVPSGMLDGTETDEWLTRLSLPSRMVFILAQTFTPMLVLGHTDTCAARFVERFGVGCSSSYDPAQVTRVLGTLLDPASHASFVDHARRAASGFIVSEPGAWIWGSLDAGEPLPAPFTPLFAAPGRHVDTDEVVSRLAS